MTWLTCQQNEARKLNNQEASAEEERKKRPVNWEAKRKRSEWEEQQDQLKKVRTMEEKINSRQMYLYLYSILCFGMDKNIRAFERSKTHKRLKEHFLIRQNRTKRANFRGNPFFLQQKTVKPTYLCLLDTRKLAEEKGRKTA